MRIFHLGHPVDLGSGVTFLVKNDTTGYIPYIYMWVIDGYSMFVAHLPTYNLGSTRSSAMIIHFNMVQSWSGVSKIGQVMLRGCSSTTLRGKSHAGGHCTANICWLLSIRTYSYSLSLGHHIWVCCDSLLPAGLLVAKLQRKDTIQEHLPSGYD
jgi:hypothetical protein